MALMVHLAGGLGNQMFQYATGRAIAACSGVELALDHITGFARDRRYRRRFELGEFPIAARTATRLERGLAGFDGLLRPFMGPHRAIRRLPWGDAVRETAQRFLPEIEAFRVTRRAWMRGYWQSPRYFESVAATIRAELEPPLPHDPRFRDLGRAMERCDGLAIGVRLYEENPRPFANARDGRVKSISLQAEAAHAVLRAHPGTRAFVFCTHRAEVLEQLRMPSGTTFVTETDGFRGAVPNLWLLSRCRHHVFNNSTFYWWGAWLSEGRHPASSGTIVASDNFINVDGLPAHWATF